MERDAEMVREEGVLGREEGPTQDRGAERKAAEDPVCVRARARRVGGSPVGGAGCSPGGRGTAG